MIHPKPPALLSRRALLHAAGAMGVLAARPSFAESAASTPMPVAYLSHGSPRLATDAARGAAIRAWGATLPRPRGIVVMTPHFASRAVGLGSTARGFGMHNLPGALQRMVPDALDYPSPPSDALAARVEGLLRASGGASSPALTVEHPARRGFDHTTWVPLLHLFPAHDAPVLEITYPYLPEPELVAFGARLAPLRDEGVLFSRAAE